MKHFFLTIGLLLFINIILRGQIVVFHENFELPSLGDSMISYSAPNPGFQWDINTRLHNGAGSSRSDSIQVKADETIYMMSNPFSTIGSTYVVLSFSQICKIDYADAAYVDVSTNNGGTWTQLTQANYTGPGQFGVYGNRFTCASYGNGWLPLVPGSPPMNNWWKQESFDISALTANQPVVYFRFRLKDNLPAGPNGNRGWFIDNIKVTISGSEMAPPVINMMPTNPSGTMLDPGPFSIRARIMDQSGIDTAFVVYSINNGPLDTLGMIQLTQDTMLAYLPQANPGDQICWYIVAIDNSMAHNMARKPVNSMNCFIVFGTLGIPFFDNFDLFSGLFTALPPVFQNQNIWQLGPPNYGVTNSAHSPPNAWDVNLTNPYSTAANCMLASPVFDFSTVVDARLSFWLNYETELYSDGTRLEYTTDGTNWQTLGNSNDPMGVNWYNSLLPITNQVAWAGNSQGWIKCRYKLSLLNNVVGPVQFRFVFNSDDYVFASGVSMDDFSITLPSPQEVELDKIVFPADGCGLGDEAVKIRIVNTGLTPINGNLTASFQKAAWAPAVSETFFGSVQPGDSIFYTFATPVDLSATGQDSLFHLKAWIKLPADPYPDDDTLVKPILSKALPLPPAVTPAYISFGSHATLAVTSPDSVEWYDSFTGGTLLGSNPSFTTPLLYSTTIYYPAVTGANGCSGIRARDTVYVGPPPPYDASPIILVTPVTGVNLGNNMVVSAAIHNLGTETIGNFPVYYSINNQPAVNETVPFTILPGDTATYTFTATADLTGFGIYHFKVWTMVPGDTCPLNDTLKAYVINKMYPYCYSGAIISVGPDIGNITVSDLNNGNPNPTYNNGQSVGTNIFYSWIPPVSLLRSQDYDISISPIYSSTHSTCYAKVFVDWNYDGYFDESTELAFTGGPTTPGNPVITGTLSVPATAQLGITLFRAVLVDTNDPTGVHACGLYGYGETEDYMALIKPQIDKDASITAVINPPVIYPTDMNSSPTVTLTNNGYLPINAAPITYQIDTDPPVSINWTGNLAGSASIDVPFPPIIFPGGDHSFCAWVSLPGDTNTTNDKLCVDVTGVRMDSIPYFDDFNGPDYFFPTSTSQSHWMRGIPNPPFFPGTPVSPPSVWAIDLNHAPYSDNASCTLTTQLFNITNLAALDISLWIKYQTESAHDGCWMEYSPDNGINWIQLGTINDTHASNWYNDSIEPGNIPAWSGYTANWTKAVYRFTNFFGLNTIRFRFRFSSNSATTNNGVSIDDFSLTVPYPTDAGVDSILTPQVQTISGTNLFPKVRLRNFGSSPINSVNVSYVAGNGIPVTETWTGNLLSGQSAVYQFTTPHPSPDGFYNLEAYTSLPDDGNLSNDTSTILNIYGVKLFTVPYEDSYDAAQSDWHTLGTQWEHGTPSSAVINSAYSPPYCWKTNLDGPYTKASAPDYLYSPMFNLLAGGYDILEFSHWVNTNFPDGGKIEYLSTTGWKTLGYMDDPGGTNWYNNLNAGWTSNGGISGWHYSAYDLTTINDFASPSQFRFTFSTPANNTTYDGWAIDNFRIGMHKIPKDAGVIAFSQPSGQITYGSDLPVTVAIRNFGTDTLYTIPVKYQINGITVNIGYWTGLLAPDSTALFTFSPIPTPLETFALCVYTDVSLDVNYFNDTLCITVPVNPPPYDLTVTKIMNPVGQTIHGDSAVVQVRIMNRGLNPVSSFPVAYAVADSMIVVTEDCHPSQPLNHGDSLDYVFIQKYSYKYLGYYYLCVYASEENDGYRGNDTLCSVLEELYTDIPENQNSSFALLQNIPNPAGNSTTFIFVLPHSGFIEFGIFDHFGRTVFRKQEMAGDGEQQFRISTQYLAAGMYYYYLQFGQERIARKMMVAR
ncbi:MAG: GEVED domain-containing protein [Bacteroidetes bacterium]|nr:GEVED domain-containing protein [Bacteroidota bacterium]